jgi:nickel transport protein
MAFCDVRVYRPAEKSEIFQTGVTDSHGRFAFVPDSAGEWRVIVEDGTGHLATASFTPGIDEAPDETAEMTGSSDSAKRGDRVREIVMGIAVIFGLFGIVALFYCRRKVR